MIERRWGERHGLAGVRLGLPRTYMMIYALRDINLWARNIGGEYMYLTAQAGRDFIVSPGAPRTYGATIGVHF